MSFSSPVAKTLGHDKLFSPLTVVQNTCFHHQSLKLTYVGLNELAFKILGVIAEKALLAFKYLKFEMLGHHQ